MVKNLKSLMLGAIIVSSLACTTLQSSSRKYSDQSYESNQDISTERYIESNSNNVNTTNMHASHDLNLRINYGAIGWLIGFSIGAWIVKSILFNKVMIEDDKQSGNFLLDLFNYILTGSEVYKAKIYDNRLPEHAYELNSNGGFVEEKDGNDKKIKSDLLKTFWGRIKYFLGISSYKEEADTNSPTIKANYQGLVITVCMIILCTFIPIFCGFIGGVVCGSANRKERTARRESTLRRRAYASTMNPMYYGYGY